MNIKEVQLTLKQLNVIPKKKFGQNFLVDSKVLHKIISAVNLNNNDVVIEIGTGLGAITSKLISIAKKVYSYEIDSRLFQYVSKKLSNYDNIELINADFLQVEIPYHNKVVSNIPYTMTGAIFEKIFYNEQPTEGVLIIEKSIANRLSISENYKLFSRICVTFNAFMELVNMQNISSYCFYPQPKIDLAMIKVKPRENINTFLLKKENIVFFLRFIAGIMPYKNKNIVNALELYFKNQESLKTTKDEIYTLLKDNNYENKKLFKFKVNDLIDLSKLIISSKIW